MLMKNVAIRQPPLSLDLLPSHPFKPLHSHLFVHTPSLTHFLSHPFPRTLPVRPYPFPHTQVHYSAADREGLNRHLLSKLLAMLADAMRRCAADRAGQGGGQRHRAAGSDEGCRGRAGGGRAVGGGL